MRNIKCLEIAAILAGASILFTAGCDNSANVSDNTKAPQVVFEYPVVKDVVLWDEYTAKIEAIASVDIRAQVGGYLKSVNFKEG